MSFVPISESIARKCQNEEQLFRSSNGFYTSIQFMQMNTLSKLLFYPETIQMLACASWTPLSTTSLIFREDSFWLVEFHIHICNL